MRPGKNRRNTERVVLAVVLVVLIISFFGLRRLPGVTSTSQDVERSAFGVGNWMRNAVGFLFTGKQSLNERVAELEAQVQRHTIDQADYTLLKEAHQSLLDLFTYSESNQEVALARVITRPNSLEGEYIVIDLGSENGIEIGQSIISGDGFYIGSIHTVAKFQSVVELMTHKTVRTSARLLNDASITGVAEGTGGVQLELDYISQNASLVVGDLILTSGQQAGVPSGLIVGYIDEVIQDEHQPFQQALIQPFIDLSNLSYVGILPKLGL